MTIKLLSVVFAVILTGVIAYLVDKHWNKTHANK